MRINRAVPAMLLGAAMIAACTKSDQGKTIDTVATVDSLALVRQQLVDEIIASTDFVNDVHEQLESARVLTLGKPETGYPKMSETGREVCFRNFFHGDG